MTVGLYTHDQLVAIQAAAVQAHDADVVDFTPGSLVLAQLEANASVGLWVQALILKVLSLTRAATSKGSDLDSWVADYGMARLPATAATGSVTFTRYLATAAATVPAGATVTTEDGTQAFQVQIDRTNAAWVESISGYRALPNQASITLPVQAQVAGSGGNVLAGMVSKITNAISFDLVTNPAPLANGLDPEPDDALRARFRLFVDSRSRATNSAVAYAVASLQQGLTYTIRENLAPDGTARQGFFTVVIDDGTGAPTSDLLARVYAVIEPIRPVGSSFAVLAPQVVSATVFMVITAAPGYRKNDLIGPVAQALLAYIDSLGIAAPLAYTRLASVAYSVPGVAEVDTVLLNGGTANIGGGPTQVVKAVLGNVSIS